MTEHTAGPAPEIQRAPRRVWSRLFLVVVWALAVTAVYLALTFAWPRNVPRLSLLPSPTAEPLPDDECSPQTEVWQAQGTFWSRSVFITGGCINDA